MCELPHECGGLTGGGMLKQERRDASGHVEHYSLADRGIGMPQVLAAVRSFRRQDAKTPVVLMGYANPIERFDLRAGEGACAIARYRMQMSYLGNSVHEQHSVRCMVHLGRPYMWAA